MWYLADWGDVVGVGERGGVMMGREYSAVVTCPCGYKEELSDKDYIAILEGRIVLRLKCGCDNYGAKIRARHKLNSIDDWRFVYGSTQGKE